MGYRANVVTQHRSYGACAFWNYTAFEKWLKFVREEYSEDSDMMHESENEDYYEIPKIIFEKEIKRLEKLSPEVIEPNLEEEVKYIIANFESALKEAVADDDFITLEWY